MIILSRVVFERSTLALTSRDGFGIDADACVSTPYSPSCLKKW